MSFYSSLDCSIKMAFEDQWNLIAELPQDWEKQRLFKGINKMCDNLGRWGWGGRSGKQVQEGGYYVCLWLIHVNVWQKPTRIVKQLFFN